MNSLLIPEGSKELMLEIPSSLPGRNHQRRNTSTTLEKGGLFFVGAYRHVAPTQLNLHA